MFLFVSTVNTKLGNENLMEWKHTKSNEYNKILAIALSYDSYNVANVFRSFSNECTRSLYYNKLWMKISCWITLQCTLFVLYIILLDVEYYVFKPIFIQIWWSFSRIFLYSNIWKAGNANKWEYIRCRSCFGEIVFLM